ncbi:MAG: hypothetical protein ACREBC_39050, partial [Pyrinomonadaceae bacterium]
GAERRRRGASLDPNNSLVTKRLGQGYYEPKRGGLASTEFEQAKLLDPKDPTPVVLRRHPKADDQPPGRRAARSAEGH